MMPDSGVGCPVTRCDHGLSYFPCYGETGRDGSGSGGTADGRGSPYDSPGGFGIGTAILSDDDVQ